ncbi:hypothetical protein QTP88_005750 [Uroleucon formosanum]
MIDPCDPVAPRPATEVSCGAAPQNGRVGVLGARLLRIAHLSTLSVYATPTGLRASPRARIRCATGRPHGSTVLVFITIIYRNDS